MAAVSRRSFLVGAATLALARPAFAATSRSFRNARIVIGDGNELDGGVRIEGGKIVEVGPGVNDGEDLGGAVLFPGFYDGGSTLGLTEIDLEAATQDAQEASDAVTPQARVVDGYNPRSVLLPVARLQGVLGALVIPGGGSLVSGQAAWVRTAGDTVDDAVIVAPAGVCFNLGHAGTGGPNGPKSRMGVAMKLRDLFDADTPKPPPAKRKCKKGEPEKPEDLTRAQKVVRALLARETKAILCAHRADDILIALALAKEFGLDAILLGAAEGHLVARQIADAKVPVLLGPVTLQPDGFDTLYARYDNAALLHAAGVSIALRQGSPHNLRDLPTEACIAVAHGLPREAAVAAVTGNGPGFWGLSVGRIAVGHEASFARCDGDPLQPRTRVTGVWMRGEPLPLVSHQTELYERFRTLH